MAEFFKGTPEMVESVKRIVAECHRRLDGARIAVIMRDKGGERGGRKVMAKAAMPTPAMEPLLREKFSFILCIAQDAWEVADPKQRDAMLDHELCHCAIDDDGPFIRPHDLEEFADVIERRGFWRLDHEESAVQMALRMHTGLAEVKAGALPEKIEAPIPENELEQAEAMVREAKRASASFLQRRFKVGYIKACRLLMALKERGVVGEPGPDGVCPVIEQQSV
jgi:hypothetical protein